MRVKADIYRRDLAGQEKRETRTLSGELSTLTLQLRLAALEGLRPGERRTYLCWVEVEVLPEEKPAEEKRHE